MRALDDRGRHPERRPAAGDHRRVVRPIRVASGRIGGHEGGGGIAQSVRWARGGQGRLGRTGPGELRAVSGFWKGEGVYVRHLSVLDFRSWERAEVAIDPPGSTVLVGRNGSGKTNLVEAIGYLATLGSHRVSADAPLIRRGASQAVVRGAVVSDGRELLLEAEIDSRKGQPGQDQPGAAAPPARSARHPADGAVRPGGPGIGPRRSHRAPRVPRRPAGDAGAPVGRDPVGLRQGAAATQRVAQERRPRASDGRGSVDPRDPGTRTWPGPAPNCWPPDWRWSPSCVRTSPRPTPLSHPYRSVPYRSVGVRSVMGRSVTWRVRQICWRRPTLPRSTWSIDPRWGRRSRWPRPVCPRSRS